MKIGGVLFTLAWVGLAYLCFGQSFDFLIFGLPLGVGTVAYLAGTETMQDDRDQLDIVLALLIDAREKWLSKPTTGPWLVTIPGLVEVFRNRQDEVYVKFKVGDTIQTFEANRSYRRLFQAAVEDLQDWREINALRSVVEKCQPPRLKP